MACSHAMHALTPGSGPRVVRWLGMRRGTRALSPRMQRLSRQRSPPGLAHPAGTRCRITGVRSAWRGRVHCVACLRRAKWPLSHKAVCQRPSTLGSVQMTLLRDSTPVRCASHRPQPSRHVRHGFQSYSHSFLTGRADLTSNGMVSSKKPSSPMMSML